jgi:hypothetical protein
MLYTYKIHFQPNIFKYSHLSIALQTLSIFAMEQEFDRLRVLAQSTDQVQRRKLIKELRDLMISLETHDDSLERIVQAVFFILSSFFCSLNTHNH